MNYKMEELVPVAGELVTKYTGNESTSVTYEKARQLMAAVIYSINEYEQTASAPQNTVMHQSADAREAYRLGTVELLKKTTLTRELYNQLMLTFDAYGNRAYSDTLTEGISSFFLHYDARFHPQDHLLTLDYPVLVSLDHLTGIDRIQCYLYCIYLEQLFLGQIPGEFIRFSLSQYHADYEELLINIPHIVLLHLMCGILAGKHDIRSAFTEEEQTHLSQKVISLSKEELTARMCDLLINFVKNSWSESWILSDPAALDLTYHQSHVKLSIPALSSVSDNGQNTDQKLLIRYLETGLPDLAAELKNAALYHNLANILPVLS